MFYRNTMKDNTLHHIKKSLENISTSEHNEEFEIKKPCVITEYNPVEDFNKLLEDGFDTDIGVLYFLLLL